MTNTPLVKDKPWTRVRSDPAQPSGKRDATRIAGGPVPPPPPHNAPPPTARPGPHKPLVIPPPPLSHGIPSETQDSSSDRQATIAAHDGVVAQTAPLDRTEAVRITGRASRVGTHLHGTEGLSTPGAEAPKLRLTAGRLIPGTRYRLMRWLGEGGMGVVYEAEHTDIERRVALKILRFDLSREPRMVQVFRDEARAASRLGSQYLVDIYDFGELPDGRLFFAMELLEGGDLVPVDEHKGMDPARLIGILRQVCKGLHVAHSAGVVHRDVKPENIIVTKGSDRPDAVKIVDFGISAMLAAGPQPRGGIAGTPHYMAPEQIMGQEFDGRLDIYSLGCMAYELLVGHPPFDAPSVEGLLHKHLGVDPTAPSQLRPDLAIPAEIEAVVLKCLAKYPKDRYTDMADLEAALCEAQIAAGIQTLWDDLPPPDLPDPERRDRLLREMPSPAALQTPPKRNLMWPLIAGGSTLAAVGLTLFLLFGRGPSAEEESIVDELAHQADDAGTKRNWVIPPRKDPDAPTAYKKVLELETLDGPAAALGNERASQLRLKFAGTLVGHGDELWDTGAHQVARDYYIWALVFDPADAHAFERSGIDIGLLNDFIVRAKRGEFTGAERLLASVAAAEVEDDPTTKEEMIAELVQAVEEDDFAPASQVALSHPTLIKGYRRRRGRARTKKAEQTREQAKIAAQADALEQAIAQAEREGAAKLRQEAELANASPATAEDDDIVIEQTSDSKTTKKKSKRRRRRGSDPRAFLGKAERNPAKAKALSSKGKDALAAGRRSEATSLFNQAIAFDRKNAKALMGLSDIYFDTGSSQKAVIYAERAVSASPSNRTYRLKLGDAYFKVLRYKDALDQYERAKRQGSSRADSRIAKVTAKLGG